jgi:hypothetical protein
MWIGGCRLLCSWRLEASLVHFFEGTRALTTLGCIKLHQRQVIGSILSTEINSNDFIRHGVAGLAGEFILMPEISGHLARSNFKK